ncbi:hypothetical protein GGI25_005238 [Coemansia spiralis]|uniref:DUF7492 domain-containing protein n=2 Tax=Coemansia TaxID=4863 RepID=A0A9W8G397_9FUNG|nr:hypothetical protein BX070DRAFT_253900 [Coemansia spiralis]KAJ1988758.1 hypothetical protein EDC05_005109 [Coemansia umbellata]KAJ2619805.1 hypothetical protein GGI26_005521 [Coemansia sp. RSA 1358]KAJ2672165.1 hypothetical protein GGI25_005238 [Coemansia spiralis]
MIRGFMARAAAALFAFSSVSVLAHSWIDCVKYDPFNQVCLGYSRGYPGRSNPDINTLYTYIFNASPAHQAMCDPIQQASMNYSSTFPMATAQPGETIYTVWEANGHFNNASPTEVTIYYFPDPKTQFTDVSQTSTAKVAGTMNFATNANCYSGSDPNSKCLGSWVVPKDLVPGSTYHFVWFWRFNENPTGQWYSTCFDLDVQKASHVVGTAPMATLLAKGNPSDNYAFGFSSPIKAIVDQVTTLPGNQSNKPTSVAQAMSSKATQSPMTPPAVVEAQKAEPAKTQTPTVLPMKCRPRPT